MCLTNHAKPSIIQQWQYIGPVPDVLLQDQVLANCKQAGISALQSYVTWAEIEKIPGKPDFSAYDPLVEKLYAHGLKWVPFLIAGPNYATPSWFHKSSDCLYAVCLEHRRQSRIQSIWNPRLPIYIKNFIKMFAGHYRTAGLFDSVLLGISGNWGEAIYPSLGGFYKNFHAHPGWWCGDEFALTDFRKYVLRKYRRIQVLNQAWDTSFQDFSDIGFPPVDRSVTADMANLIIQNTPWTLRPVLSSCNSIWTKTISPFIGQVLERLKQTRKKASDIGQLRYRLDFTRWYQDAMTQWARFWLKTAREYFPENDIQLVTGGASSPESGTDFSAQAKAAASCGGGIRITNQNDDYAQSFILTRLAASACRNYQASFSTEEAGINKAYGVTMRIFDGVTTGASGLYFKELVKCGNTPCGKQAGEVGGLSAGTKNLIKYYDILSLQPSSSQVAVFYPDTDTAVRPEMRNKIWHQCRRLRHLLDFDMIDEQMVMDDHISNYRFLIVLEGGWITVETLSRIFSWVRSGGILLFYDRAEFKPINGPSAETGRIYLNMKKYMKLGDGHIYRPDGLKKMASIAAAVYNRDNVFDWSGIPDIPRSISRCFYATRLHDKIIAFDPSSHSIQVIKTA